MICFVLTHRCRRLKWARVESSVNLDESEILTLTFMSNRLGDGPPSADIARHALQRPALHCGSWSTAAAAGARETWLEECESHYKDYVMFAEEPRDYWAERWVFPATTEF